MKRVAFAIVSTLGLAASTSVTLDLVPDTAPGACVARPNWRLVL